MRVRWKGLVLLGGLAVATSSAWQGPAPAPAPAARPDRFEFQVVESFDAKYLGDTPGHLGRGNLRTGSIGMALGDPVYRGDVKVGKVSSLVWSRTKESLEVEFDPEPFETDPHGRPLRAVRIEVGQTVWIPLHGAEPKKAP